MSAVRTHTDILHIFFDVDEAVRLRAEGMPLRKIARELHVGLGTITRALRAEEERSATVSAERG